jgi:hypothetical protein
VVTEYVCRVSADRHVLLKSSGWGLSTSASDKNDVNILVAPIQKPLYTSGVCDDVHKYSAKDPLTRSTVLVSSFGLVAERPSIKHENRSPPRTRAVLAFETSSSMLMCVLLLRRVWSRPSRHEEDKCESGMSGMT